MVEIRNAVMVVAHPDDEILWFSSILEQCKSVLVCFGPSTTSKESWDSGRALLMETYPLDKVKFFKLRQAGGFDAANWRKPKETESGLQFRGRSSELYERNARELRRILEPELTRESIVFTHNPWGEYGHAEHVQVFRVLTELKEELGFDLFVNSYVSNRSATLMLKCLHLLEGTSMMHETNVLLAQRIKKLYLEKNCWTWAENYEWPTYEAFYRIVRSDVRNESRTSASLPLNYISRNFSRNPLRAVVKRALPPSILKFTRGVRHAE